MSRVSGARAEYRAALRGLAPGQSAEFRLPDGQPGKRDAYLRAAGVACSMWGDGGYRLRSVPGGVVITRTAARVSRSPVSK